jgi:hypothetical protein
VGGLEQLSPLHISSHAWKHGSDSVIPLLLLGIIGLAATVLEFKQGKVAFSVKKLQNIYKHHIFHYENRMRY